MAEKGHAKVVANFETLIAICTGFGGDYKPTNPLIELPAMTTWHGDSQSSLTLVQQKLVPWKNKVADRENVYDGIRPLSTQLLNGFDACGADKNKVDNVRTFNRQVQGQRAKALPVDDPDTPENEAAGNSVSHRSYVQVAAAFGQIVEILAAEPLYTPNEAHLQVATVQARLAAMQAANTDVLNAAVPLANERITRNERLYSNDNGIRARAALVKKYVKSVYGATSPQYALVSGLDFNN